jgi:miniconductance mechanosensitive channel
MSKYSHYFYDYFLSTGMSADMSKYLNMLILLVIVLVVTLSIDYLIKIIIRKISVRIASGTKTKFDDILIANKLPRNVAHVPALVLFFYSIPHIFRDFKIANIAVIKIVQVLGIVLTLYIARSIFNSIKDYLKTVAKYRDKPIDSYIQVFMIFAWFAGFFLAFTVITEIAIWKFFTALGTVSAVIILVFKDTILGFVASIQVSINDMVRIGDWITFEKYGADGDVVEINLATVKVQNFDNTITTIPTYAMISDSFKNWRGMLDSPGRRIKRALFIRQDTVKYLTSEDIERLKGIDFLTNYLTTKKRELDIFNETNVVNKDLILNGRNLTNIGVFRKYIELYLQQHSAVHKDLFLMARQLQPTNNGIPIEVYAFSRDKKWENYEYIQADIFDHLLASIQYFDLEVFESPNSKSFK